MRSITALLEQVQSEFVFETSRSGGKGGQHVNKVESRVTLVWEFMESRKISEEEKQLITEKAKSYVSGSVIRVSTEEYRSQVKNKKKSIYKLRKILEEAFHKTKPRKKSFLPKSVKEKRMKEKKLNSEIKNSRKKIDKRNF